MFTITCTPFHLERIGIQFFRTLVQITSMITSIHMYGCTNLLQITSYRKLPLLFPVPCSTLATTWLPKLLL